MKKLILSMLIVLGTIVSTQAQFRVWNFSCGPVDNAGPIVENEWSLISHGFSSDQIDELVADGYGITTDANSNEKLSQLFSGIDRTVVYDNAPDFTFQVNATVSVQVGVFHDQRNGLGPYSYRVNTSSPGQFNDISFFEMDATAEVVDYLINIYADQDIDPNSDEDGNGFTVAEEELLAAPIDNLGTGNFEPFGDFTTYQIFFGTDQEVENIEISIANGMFRVTYFVNGDDVSEMDYATLELAMAAAEAIINP